MYLRYYKAAYFLGGVLTGILGIAAAACISSLVDERNRYKDWWEESLTASKTASPAETEASAAEVITDEANPDAMQTA